MPMFFFEKHHLIKWSSRKQFFRNISYLVAEEGGWGFGIPILYVKLILAMKFTFLFLDLTNIHTNILLEWKTYFRDRETAWHSLIRIFSNKMNIHSRCMHLAQWSVQKPGGTPLSDFQNFTFLDQDPILWQIVWLVNGGWLPKCLTTLNMKYHLSSV